MQAHFIRLINNANIPRPLCIITDERTGQDSEGRGHYVGGDDDQPRARVSEGHAAGVLPRGDRAFRHVLRRLPGAESHARPLRRRLDVGGRDPGALGVRGQGPGGVQKRGEVVLHVHPDRGRGRVRRGHRLRPGGRRAYRAGVRRSARQARHHRDAHPHHDALPAVHQYVRAADGRAQRKARVLHPGARAGRAATSRSSSRS